jgi:putative SOS response-associated peptidase YedK
VPRRPIPTTTRPRLRPVCGRFTQQTPTSEIARIFEAEDLAFDPGERYNVAPTDPAAVVVERRDEETGTTRRAVVRYRWGLLPHWVDDPRAAASKAFNARAETVATSGLFREAFRRRRCLVPVDSFFEWQGSGSARHPLRILDPAGMPLALAGLWAGRRDPVTGEVLRTFTIVTTRPNAFMAPIHDRMPVILRPDAWGRWLARDLADPAELLGLLTPDEDLALVAHAVPRLVNNVRNQGPALIERIEEEPAQLPLTAPARS